jgi:hypothetical protein
VLKTNAEKALWFLESFGLKLDKLSLIDINGDDVNLQYNGAKKAGYQYLMEEEQHLVKNVVYIMDKFCVSDVAYHKFTMFDQGLPRSHLIKQCKQDVNKISCISRTPDEWPCAKY